MNSESKYFMTNNCYCFYKTLTIYIVRGDLYTRDRKSYSQNNQVYATVTIRGIYLRIELQCTQLDNNL